VEKRSVFNQVLLIPPYSPILNFYFPKFKNLTSLRATLRYPKAKKNKNQEEKRKLNTRTGRELSDDKLYTMNLYPVSK